MTSGGRLDGKVAVVTGAGRGIGRAISLLFAQEGAKVVVASRSPGTVDEVVAEIEKAGGTALGVPTDVGDRDAVFGMVEKAAAAFGTVDILVNNAQSFGTPDKPQSYPSRVGLEVPNDVEWEFIWRTGVMATTWGMQAAFPHMKAAGGGRIINFGSMAGQRGESKNAPYNAAKEAIRAITRTGAREWGRYGITVNVINPAAMTYAQEAFQRDFPPPPNQDNAKHVPLRRLGDSLTDIAPVALFLASADGAYITGMTMMADGGLLMSP